MPHAEVRWFRSPPTAAAGRNRRTCPAAPPRYSGAKIIYRTTENVPGTPADSYIVPAAGGTPAKYETGAGRGGGRGGANRWIDATHVLADRTSPDFKRRDIFSIDITTGAQ